ncbi:hypothetical protein [Streptomyces sp. NPDC001492]
MIGRAIGVGIVCAPFISALLLGLGRAGRALHHRCVDWLDQLLDPDGRAHRIAYPILHPHQFAYAAWLRATDRWSSR